MQRYREIWTLLDVSKDDAPVVARVDGPGGIQLAVVFDSESAARDFVEAEAMENTVAFPFESVDFALETLAELPAHGITHFAANPTVIHPQSCWPIPAFVAEVRNRLRMRENTVPSMTDRGPTVTSPSVVARV